MSSVHKYHKSCSHFNWPFYGLLQLYELKLQNSHISVSSVQRLSQIVFSGQLTVVLPYTTIWANTSRVSYLREISAVVSQIVVSFHLTVLRLITTVWAKISKISYLSQFSARVSEIVFLAYLTVLLVFTTVWAKTSKISYLRDFSAQVSQIVFSFHLNRFMGYYNCMS